ncbi:DUF29 domain-containing protein [Nodosilinea sp. LEGE 07298]|uniref:DUF29 domain-containing protein n=1 Tax=Nodosilinea sp. LEGE 07298 TaxID=2777970 RepID=UPI00187E6A36|nr:DUF29 domain-containing protein [Nodosilinea sp. LEGE 07298]MBE9109202.1 DUF29 domain-containing protein [Nodosilinea sp. LEGE 07298]
MSTETDVKPKSLYDRDYQLWLDNTVAHLKSRNFDAIDLENLIEELESLGRSDKKSLNSYLKRLCEHLLKLSYWETERERCFSGWDREIENFRQEIQEILDDSPSLRSSLRERYSDEYIKGRKLFLKVSKLDAKRVPESPCFSLEQALDDNWLPWRPDSETIA